jgi:hypothetical protein
LTLSNSRTSKLSGILKRRTNSEINKTQLQQHNTDRSDKANQACRTATSNSADPTISKNTTPQVINQGSE